MAFVLNNKRIHSVKRDDHASSELPNIALHGLTPNGTYFYCNLVYKKDISVRKKMSILALVDAYANTQTDIERVQLKNKIKEACGEQIDGISLLFSNANETYGFVSGTRIKVATIDKGNLVELDAEEMFTDSRNKHLYLFHVFILENENENTPDLIKRCLKENVAPIDNINTIKHIGLCKKTTQYDMDLYLKAACSAIQNSSLKPQVEAVYNALQRLDTSQAFIKHQATVLTIQLLHSENNEHRKQLLTEYNKVASTLYGSKVPSLMIVGIAMLTLAITAILLAMLFTSLNTAIIIGLITIPLIAVGISEIIEEKNDFYNEDAKQKRGRINTLFSLKKELSKTEEPIIPTQIKDSESDPHLYSRSSP